MKGKKDDVEPTPKKKSQRKDTTRVLIQTLFPNIFSSYEDTENALGKKAIKITTETAKQEGTRVGFYEAEGGGKIQLGKYVDDVIPDDQAYVKATSGLKKIAKPKNFKSNKPSTIKLPVGTGAGANCIQDAKSFVRPKKPLILYEAEDDKDCKKVREVMSALDLTVIIRPCASGRYGWSDDQARITGGERTLPYLIDNSGMYEFRLCGGKEIIPYLFENYGPGKDIIPNNLKAGPKGSSRAKMAKNVRPDFIKIKPVTLYTFEGCPASVNVRKTLESLGISHKIIFCSKGGKNRDNFIKSKNIFQVPFLQDPNTRCDLYESKDIIRYLNEVYGL